MRSSRRMPAQAVSVPGQAPRGRRADPARQLCSARGRRRAHVGDEIRDGEVHFVADAATTRDRQARIARATRSSLKDHRSSIEPPPRATISTSHSRRAAASSMRAHDLGHRRRALHGGRIDEHRRAAESARASTRKMSRIAAPVGEVTTPMRRGTARQRALALGGEQPFRRELGLELLELALERAFARFLHVLDDQLVFAARLVQADARRAPAPACPPCGGNRSRVFRWRNIAQRTCASRSLSEKYQWPEAGAAKFESSPSSHSIRPGRDSSSSRHFAIEARDRVDDRGSRGGSGEPRLAAACGSRRSSWHTDARFTAPTPVRTIARHSIPRIARRRSGTPRPCEFSKKR